MERRDQRTQGWLGRSISAYGSSPRSRSDLLRSSLKQIFATADQSSFKKKITITVDGDPVREFASAPEAARRCLDSIAPTLTATVQT